jgi:hypothetical protein
MPEKKKEVPNHSAKAPPMPAAPLSAVSPRGSAAPERISRPPKRPKMGKNILVCSFYALVALLIAFSLFLFCLAKTGLVSIPFISSLCAGQKPVRIVEAAASDPEALLERISSVVSSAVGCADSGPYPVVFSEQDLTASARGGLEDILRGREAAAERIQIAVTSDFIEASGLITTRGMTVDALARFDAVVEDGELHLNIREAYLGDVPIHPDLARQLEGVLFTKDFASWNVSAGDVKLKDVILGDGEMELVFE